VIVKADRSIQIRRIYEDPSDDDGHRVLVDRLWPRGVSKEAAALDAWIREVAPSDELRRWYSHDPDRTSEFVTRYRSEVDHGDRGAALEELAALAATGRLTLLTATRDLRRSHAAVLAQLLRERRS
jgi:uncharacterized protein YeaO (DUF488 family)